MKKNLKDTTQNADLYRGVTIDKADDCKVSPSRVKADVAELNNNPRTNEIDN